MSHADRLTGFVFLIILALATATIAQNGQISQVTNPGVAQRMATMNGASAALTTLSDMIGGKAFFDKERATAARKHLIAATVTIPSVFRAQHIDPLSNAKPLIWSQWDDFKTRARTARRAARALDTGTLPDLRQSLPRLVLACLSCHRTYRRAPR